MSKVPEKAMVLAAGFGSRLQPLSSAVPKPLIPLWGRSLLDRCIDLLGRHGVKEIVINAHWHVDILREHIAAADYGMKVQLSVEENIRGTGGALLPWRDYFSGEPFWVINGDIAASADFESLKAAVCPEPGILGSCWVTAEKGPRTVEVDRAGRITCYRSPDPGVDGTYTFCGVQLLNPEIFRFIEEREFSTLVDAYENAMQRGLFMRGVEIPGSYWNDAGTFQRYREIHMETKRLALSGRAGGELYDSRLDLLRDQRSGFLCAGRTARLSKGVSGRDSIVFDGVSLGAGSVLKNAVVAGGDIDGRIEDACCIGGRRVDDDRIRDAAAAINWDAGSCAFALIGRRGSNRTFWRGFNGQQRAIFIVDDGGRPENLRYAGHTRILKKAGLPVPELLYESEDSLSLVIEDMGDTSLTRKMQASPGNSAKIYESVVGEVARFHRRATEIVQSEQHALEPAFDLAMYQWERDLFEKHLLQGRLGYECIPGDVRDELASLATDLCGGSRVVIHRDLQSSNILFKGRQFVFIDFQGMRFGSPAYDLASLLYDPYVVIDPKTRCRLVSAYAALMPECSDIVTLFFKGAVQRLIQSLGAFGRLTGAGHAPFEKHILPGLVNLLEAADAANLDAVGALAEDLIVREQMRTSG